MANLRYTAAFRVRPRFSESMAGGVENSHLPFNFLDHPGHPLHAIPALSLELESSMASLSPADPV